MSENKTHYRNVFKSDHLGVADLEEMKENNKPLTFTIKEVKQEIGVSVAGRKGNHNIAYFKEKIKPLVLNATNSKVIRLFTGSPFVQDWNNIEVDLYIDSTVKMKGETVGGVRLRVNGLDESDMILEKLKVLYMEKEHLISDANKVHFKRVIDNKEKTAYNKAMNALNNL